MVDWSAPASEASTKRLLYEIALGFLVMTSPIIQLVENQAISWIGVGTGVFAIALCYAFLRTSLGARLNDWFRRIGIGSRAIIIVLAVPIISGTVWSLRPPAIPLFSFIVGSMGTLVSATILRILGRFSRRRQQHPA